MLKKKGNVSGLSFGFERGYNLPTTEPRERPIVLISKQVLAISSGAGLI